MSTSLQQRSHHQGFTLIELSIVLVIIGLIVGGVLVGQTLVSAAAVRATVAQVEKYNQAANTFMGKYGYLPGDIPDPAASSFGFAARGTAAGEGDGNGMIQGGNATPTLDHTQCYGEVLMFWKDLSTAKLIEGSFTQASPSLPSPNLTWTTSPGFANYFPAAKIGGNNLIYVYNTTAGASVGHVQAANFYGLVAGIDLGISTACEMNNQSGLTVAQAYAIDTKVDDGKPQSGNVIAAGLYNYYWAAGPSGSGGYYPGDTNNFSASSTTCYDNGGNGANPAAYSVGFNNGANVNCALSFKMLAGD